MFRALDDDEILIFRAEKFVMNLVVANKIMAAHRRDQRGNRAEITLSEGV